MSGDAHLVFAPRLLFLSRDPARVREALAGARVGLAAAPPLRDDVSTDEITPLTSLVQFDATLGRYPYTGFKAAGERPIDRDAVREAGIEVVVAGKRYGKGSSREHSVVAERAAGDRRELRAHLPAERRQRGAVDQHRFLVDRAH